MKGTSGKSIAYHLCLLSIILIIHPLSANAANKQLTGALYLLLQNEWQLTWSDEFTGDTIDTSKWQILGTDSYYSTTPRKPNTGKPDGWWLADNVSLSGNGTLVIKASVIADKNDDNDSSYDYDYATGALRSRGLFEQQYGKFEISCKLPTQQGWWVAFWLSTDSVNTIDGSGVDGTEIDIMEGFGWNNRINHALHWDGYGTAHRSISSKDTIAGIRDGFHKYTLIWSPDEYLFLVDDELKWQTDASAAGGVSTVPEYIKITGEISTADSYTSTSWANEPIKDTFPDTFVVDWVRVYSLKK